ncbi:MAG: hypothetical protein RL701_7237 [Pseudomonadota bacterium]
MRAEGTRGQSRMPGPRAPPLAAGTLRPVAPLVYGATSMRVVSHAPQPITWRARCVRHSEQARLSLAARPRVEAAKAADPGNARFVRRYSKWAPWVADLRCDCAQPHAPPRAPHVRVETVGDHDDRARFCGWLPRAVKDVVASDAFETALFRGLASCLSCACCGADLPRTPAGRSA